MRDPTVWWEQRRRKGARRIQKAAVAQRLPRPMTALYGSEFATAVTQPPFEFAARRAGGACSQGRERAAPGGCSAVVHSTLPRAVVGREGGRVHNCAGGWRVLLVAARPLAMQKAARWNRASYCGCIQAENVEDA